MKSNIKYRNPPSKLQRAQTEWYISKGQIISAFTTLEDVLRRLEPSFEYHLEGIKRDMLEANDLKFHLAGGKLKNEGGEKTNV